MLGLLGDLADLVLPAACAGCGIERLPLRYGVCDPCASALEALRPFRAAPTPPPPGFPPCVAVGAYEGPLRGVLLAYKERGRHRLPPPLRQPAPPRRSARCSPPRCRRSPRPAGRSRSCQCPPPRRRPGSGTATTWPGSPH